MKKDEKSTNEAREFAPQTGVEEVTITKQAPSKAPQIGAKKRRGKTFLTVALLMIWVFCSVVVSQLVLGYLLIWILGPEKLNQPVWNGLYAALSYILALVLIIVVPPKVSLKWQIDGKRVQSEGKRVLTTVSREQLGLKGTPTWTDIGLAPIAFFVSTLGAGVLVTLFQVFSWFDAAETQETGFTAYMTGGEKVVAFLTLVVAAPIVEEIIFRGWLYGKLRAKLKMPLAIILVSLLFGLMHFQWNVGVNVFALSVVLCGLREITGTIYAGILTHMVKNGVAFYLLYVLGM